MHKPYKTQFGVSQRSDFSPPPVLKFIHTLYFQSVTSHETVFHFCAINLGYFMCTNWESEGNINTLGYNKQLKPVMLGFCVSQVSKGTIHFLYLYSCSDVYSVQQFLIPSVPFSLYLRKKVWQLGQQKLQTHCVNIWET